MKPVNKNPVVSISRAARCWIQHRMLRFSVCRFRVIVSWSRSSLFSESCCVKRLHSAARCFCSIWILSLCLDMIEIRFETVAFSPAASGGRFSLKHWQNIFKIIVFSWIFSMIFHTKFQLSMKFDGASPPLNVVEE